MDVRYAAKLLVTSCSALMVSACGGGGDPTPLAVATNLEDPNQFQCVGRNFFNGLPVAPFEVAVPVAPGNAIAFTNFDPSSGIPVIQYSAQYFGLSRLLQSFSKRHECAHANVIVDEIQANCAALVQMRSLGLTPQQEQAIEQFHLAMGPLPAQYGGSGIAFWQLTLQCAGPRSS